MTIRPPTSDASPPRIIALATNLWDGPWMNRQQLLSRLGCHLPIVYSTGAYHSWDRSGALWRGSPWLGRFERRDNVWVDHPARVHLRVRRLPGLDRAVVKAASRRLIRRLRSAGDGPLIAHVFFPTFLPYVEAIQPDFVIYHAYDRYSGYPDWTDEQDRAQSSLVRIADLVVASSSETRDDLAAHGPTRIEVLPNGVDFDRFRNPESLPESVNLMARIPRPRIAYFGNLNRKVDVALIEDLAIRNPQWHLVLVGVYRDNCEKTLSAIRRCEQLPNVHLLGHQDYKFMPSLMSETDVLLLCYRVDDQLWSGACSPLKLYEYLAVGRPVVSANFLAARECRDVISIAGSSEDWTHLIQESLDKDNSALKQMRMDVAAQNTWDDRVNQLLAWIRELAG